MAFAIKLLLVSLLPTVVLAGSTEGPTKADVDELRAEIKELRDAMEHFARTPAAHPVKSERRLFGPLVYYGDYYDGYYDDAYLAARNETVTKGEVDDLLAEVGAATSSAWLVVCGALVMFMHAGFAMLETGCCRAKNASNVLMKNLVNVCVGTIGWYFFGWGFAYGDPLEDGFSANGFIGHSEFFANGFMSNEDDGTVVWADNKPLGWFFQWAFCTAAATIVSGAVAERVLSPTYAAYAFVMASFVYPVVVHWTWGYGWLASLLDVGYMDFAGSGIVHLCGGVSGLAGTIVLGPRKGRFERPEEFEAHNLPLAVLGTLALWFGWYGFNCGSTLGMGSAERGAMAAHVAMTTTISAAVGGITVFALKYVLTGLYDVGALCNGILGGLVSITAPCGNVEAGSAFAIGLIGGFVYLGSSMLLQKLKIDDPVDAVPVHGFCGIWGVMAAAFFDWGKGFDTFHGWSGFSCMTGDDGCDEGIWGKVFAVQIVLCLAVIAWSGTLSGLTFFALKLTGKLRIDEETEDSGIDAKKHSPGKAYAMQGLANGNTIMPYKEGKEGA